MTDQTKATLAEISAMRKRCEAATAGPWECKAWRIFSRTHCKVICDTANNRATRTAENATNAEMMAAARTDLPALIAAVEDLVVENAALRKAK